MRRGISIILLTLCVLGCSEIHDQKYGVRFDAEYYAKLKVCEGLPLKSRIASGTLDNGERVHVSGRSAEWYSKSKYLGDTCYKASIGPYLYRDEGDEDPDFYAIDVQVKTESAEALGGYVWQVLFARQFHINDISDELLYQNVHEVVSFEPSSRTVTFSLDEKSYVYELPRP